MIKQIRTFGLAVSFVLFVLHLTTGCTKLAEEPNQTKVAPKKISPSQEGSEEQEQIVKLALKFMPADLTTYKVTTDADNSLTWESTDANKPKGFTGGHTGRKSEITFTQQIQSIGYKGNAVAKITIKELKYLQTVKNEITMDFDSSRGQDQQHPLSKLIGLSYTIEMTASGEVSKIIDANDARAAVKGTSTADKMAVSFLSDQAIIERHKIPALPETDKSQLRVGEDWSIIKGFSFTMMGTKTYEKIYTLKEIKDVDNRRIAIAQMEAVPSAEKAKEQYEEQSASFFANMSDNTETYTGELKLDLTAGKVDEYHEKLITEWLIVDPNPKEGKPPAALKMGALRSYSIEKID